MILTVAEFRDVVTTDVSDQVLQAKLEALEMLIRNITNNNFQIRAFRTAATIEGTDLLKAAKQMPFKVGDTLEITESALNQNRLAVVESIDGCSITTLQDDLFAEDSAVVITKVSYPADVKLGVCKLLQWDLERSDKVGIASETISRHSVTYFDMTGDNSSSGYPKALTGFLKPYMKARFGRGIRV